MGRGEAVKTIKYQTVPRTRAPRARFVTFEILLNHDVDTSLRTNNITCESELINCGTMCICIFAKVTYARQAKGQKTRTYNFARYVFSCRMRSYVISNDSAVAFFLFPGSERDPREIIRAEPRKACSFSLVSSR